ncbi:Methionine aminopeptidase [Rubripirellula lacrimiformis]|uniref:Methionine aminopeptidase n=1 Tax=Rubripirellula lacrimiformis TaxID=1930273 RepID=A0A517NCG6_9BACT|nr:type I methionyl aminopeptidase [Rubripirellula lacrimiformis]QDT04748.1 Methionine aminopeptidase [Rubripirellula lacrimiformis]
MLKKQKKLILTTEQQDAMRRAGRVNARLLDYIRPHVTAGISTRQIDEMIHGWTIDNGHVPATLGYQNYPKSCCTSINDVICHGIPDEYVLQDGDIINVDITTIVDGWHGDQSETFLIGDVSEERRAVTQCAFDCLYLAIEALTPGCRVSTIGETVVPEAHRRGFTVVREYVGHGLGLQFHLDPSVPHFPNRQSRIDRLYPGMCFTVEPMINAGSRYTRSDKDDGWTVRTKDGRASAQFEHSLLMTEDGPEILTLTEDGPRRGHQFESNSGSRSTGDANVEPAS